MSAATKKSEKYAVVKLQDRQHLVKEGDVLEVNRMTDKVGSKIELKEVLLTVDGEKVAIGQPLVVKATVSAEVVANKQGDKVESMTYKAKARQRRHRGHRQQLTVLKITKV